ncbi:peptidoglycan-associated lipoprotein Pal [candidate division KSB1 bacterium]|nr:peptidoglycan-associated lipoprotein Pal [candidate division KSB1 bacterium]
MQKWITFFLITGSIATFIFTGCQKKTTQTPALVQTPQPTTDSRTPIDEKQNRLETYTPEPEATVGTVTNVGNNLFQDIHFEFDKSDLSQQAREILAEHARTLRANPRLRLQIEGHCDDRGTIEYNLALGDRRAHTVRNYLINLGIEAARLATISYGEERPLDPNSQEEAWSRNRRAAFVIIQK